MSTLYGLLNTKSAVKSDHGNLSFDGVGIDSWDFATAGKALKAMQQGNMPVSYTHLTLPTKRIV